MSDLRYIIDSEGQIKIIEDENSYNERIRSFKRDLKKLINNYSLENTTDTPDFILADYLVDCLQAMHDLKQKRDKWYCKDIEKGVKNE